LFRVSPGFPLQTEQFGSLTTFFLINEFSSSPANIQKKTLVKEIKVDDSFAAGQLLARRKRSRRRTVHALWSSPARASNSDVRYSSVPSAAPGVASAHAFPNLAIKPFAGWPVPRRPA
jgi:hypothetical protein